MRTSILLYTICTMLEAAPPVLNSMYPPGAQRGKTVTVTLSGASLMEGAKIVSTLPATFTPLASEMPNRKLSFLAELKPDAPVGLYPVRIQAANGLSNVLLFSVGGLPEIQETESANDTLAMAQTVKSTPILINGNLKAADRDFYQIYAKAGEKRVLEVEARRAGSGIDPTLLIYNSAGKLLKRVQDTAGLGVDCRIEFTFPSEGNYFVEIHDARFSDQGPANFYRFKMGAYSYGDAIFPLGWTRNQAVDVEVSGGNLTAPVKVKPGADRQIHLPNSVATLPIPFVTSDGAETLEPAGAGPHVLTAGTVVNGRILKAGEVDRYRLAVEPGRSYIVEADARGLGTSRLDALLTVYDVKGKRIESAGDKPPIQAAAATIVAGDYSRDPFVIFQAPSDAREITVTVEDLNGGGGEGYGYRLKAGAHRPDFELTLSTPFVNVPAGGTAIVTVSADRRGYMGPIELSVAKLPADIEVSGGNIPGESNEIDGRGVSRRGVLTLTAKKGAPARALELEVWGEAKLPDGVVKRKASGPGMLTAIRGNFGFVDPSRRAVRPFQAPWLGYELPAMVGYEPAGAIQVKGPKRIRIIQGMKYDFDWVFEGREMGMGAPNAVAPDTPGGRDLRISDGNKRRPGAGQLSMNTTIGTPASTFDVILSARVNDEVIYAPAITVDVVQGYHVEPPEQSGLVLTGKVMREEGFNAPIAIAPDALPLGVTCPPVEVANGATSYSVRCEATGEAPAGEHTILLNPASILPQGEKGQVPYKIAPVEATLRIKK